MRRGAGKKFAGPFIPVIGVVAISKNIRLCGLRNHHGEPKAEGKPHRDEKNGKKYSIKRLDGRSKPPRRNVQAFGG